MPIKYWVDNACIGLDSNDRWPFRKEVGEIGAPAMPYLLRRLRATDTGRNLWNAFRSHLPESWQRGLPERRDGKEIRYSAARTIAMVGPAAKSAVPDLIRLLPENPSVMLGALSAIGPDASNALPAIRLMVTNTNFSVRIGAARAIWRIGRETNLVFRICTNTLVQSPGIAAINTCGLLSELGPAAQPAAPLVLKILQDTNSQARGNAAIVLGKIRLSTPEIRQALLDGLKQEQNKNLQANFAMALWALDPGYASLATRLVIESIAEERKRFPDDPSHFTEWLTYRELDPGQSVPTLKQLLTNDSPQIRVEAAEALARIESAAKTSAKK